MLDSSSESTAWAGSTASSLDSVAPLTTPSAAGLVVPSGALGGGVASGSAPATAVAFFFTAAAFFLTAGAFFFTGAAGLAATSGAGSADACAGTKSIVSESSRS